MDMPESQREDEYDAYLEQYGDDEERGDRFCYTCYGRGFIVNCVDDICHGSDDGCIHGDGNVDCPDCDRREWD